MYARTALGVVTLRTSRPDSRPASEAFTDVWRTQVQPVVAAPAPDPQLLQQGDFAIAVGGGQVRIQDRIRVGDDRDQTGAHARHRRHG